MLLFYVLRARVTANRGLELRTHADLWEFATKLSSELGDLEILRLFATANYLHQNFYENVTTLKAVRASAEAGGDATVAEPSS